MIKHKASTYCGARDMAYGVVQGNDPTRPRLVSSLGYRIGHFLKDRNVKQSNVGSHECI